MIGKSINKTLKIEGMHCDHCASRVESCLTKIKGIKNVKIDVASGNIDIVCKKEIDNSIITTAIEDLGYSVVSIL